MAKVKFYETLGAGSWIGQYYNDDTLQFNEGSTGRKAIYDDLFNDTSLIFKGSGLKYSEDDMIRGTINEIVFVNADSDVLYKIAGLDQKASALSVLMGSPLSIEQIINRALRGKDTIIGSDLGDYMVFDKGNDRINGGNGDDFISGGRGVDILTGGQGSDFFAVNGNSGRDIIKDFHADGGEGIQDYLSGNFDIVTLKKQGNDLLVIYDDMINSFLLEDIKKAQIDATDFT